MFLEDVVGSVKETDFQPSSKLKYDNYVFVVFF